MSIPIEQKAFAFFKKYITFQQPVLLGLSGGPDSMCLLHLLLAWQKLEAPQLLLHLVHIDHGWRLESAHECESLAAISASLGLPFHTMRCTPEAYQGNLEAEAREDRLAFFRTIMRQVKAQGILLAHQLDDQAETVLKRFLEGTSLMYLSGMHPVHDMDGLILLRPLLDVPKADILGWLHEHGISYFNDVTNTDSRFLRGRMRTDIFPYLTKTFGKECQKNIARIAQEAQEVRKFFDDRMAGYLQNPIRGPFGICFDMSQEVLTSVEATQFFRKMGELFAYPWSQDGLHTAIELFMRGAANKWINKVLYLDRRRVFLFNSEDILLPTAPQKLTLGISSFGPWQIIVRERSEQILPTHKNHWQDMWRGYCSTIITHGEYVLMMPSSKMRYQNTGKIVDKLLNERKVPRKLATLCPVIHGETGIVADFLLGNKNKHTLPVWEVTVTFPF